LVSLCNTTISGFNSAVACGRDSILFSEDSSVIFNRGRHAILCENPSFVKIAKTSFLKCEGNGICINQVLVEGEERVKNLSSTEGYKECKTDNSKAAVNRDPEGGMKKTNPNDSPGFTSLENEDDLRFVQEEHKNSVLNTKEERLHQKTQMASVQKF